MGAHHFEFSPRFRNGHRICAACDRDYDHGEHIEITTLKPYTSYVCPNDTGRGHSAIWTGAHLPANRTPTQHLCDCGAEFIEEDRETWRLTWEMQTPDRPDWHTVSKVASGHETAQQESGLRRLAEQGDGVRNVRRTRLVEEAS
ncbi:hypothetical protein [Isoptericola aurantiacus]|uniref:hypothetical protein n=1 Tax=Isoptericola aurantiacus TaxID=3377839 RepID=UPI00383B28D0